MGKIGHRPMRQEDSLKSGEQAEKASEVAEESDTQLRGGKKMLHR